MVPNVLIINLAIVMHISNVTVYNYVGYLLKLLVIIRSRHFLGDIHCKQVSYIQI